MTAVRMLGVCGLLSALFSFAGGFLDRPGLIGAGGLVMIVGNVYAMVKQ